MPLKQTRRDVLKQGLIVGGGIAAGVHSSSACRAKDSPNEKLRLAAVGTQNRAGANISGCASENIIAIADIDSQFLDQASSTYKDANKYTDFRVMLEREEDRLDGVIVATPDHTHAPAAAMALRMGKHVYCEKPLTHTVYEARTLANLAAEKKLVTQMGTQIHAGDNYRRVVELIQSGSIGKVREVHVWVGVNYAGAKRRSASKPKHVDWDLWLGPATERAYVEATINGQDQTVHPFHWRWFWDYGTGGLGDFGCHYMDLPFWALDLKHPTSIVSSGPPVDPVATTAGLRVKYEFPARKELPPVTMHWYDGGLKPDILSTLRDSEGKPLAWGSGQLFVGEDGYVISNYGQHLLLPKQKGGELKRPEPYIPSSIGHHNEWISAIKNNETTTCNFAYSGALTETVLLGVASYKSGEAIEWDGKHLKATNSSKAQSLIHKEYRKGWSL